MTRSPKATPNTTVAAPPVIGQTKPPVVIQPGTESTSSSKKTKGVDAAENKAVELDGRRKYFELRHSWSKWIIGWITVLIIFNALLTGLVGMNVFDFKEYKWFITTVTVETFLQIVGIGYIAVKFLFSK